MTPHFHRDGREATPEEIAKSCRLTASSIGYQKRNPCGRCGGLGGSDKWKHTGWTCYSCGGSGLGGYSTVKLYTAEKLATLNETQAKSRAKKAAAAEAKRLAALVEARKSRKEHAPAAVREFVTMAWPLRRKLSFVNDILRTVLKTGRVSDGQRAAVVKIVYEEARRERSTWVGEVGERVKLTLSVRSQRIVSYRASRFSRSYDGTEPVYLTIFEDEAGNTFKTFKTVPLAFYTYDAENREDVLQIGKPVKVKATIKSHDEYKGEKSTMLQRISTKGA